MYFICDQFLVFLTYTIKLTDILMTGNIIDITAITISSIQFALKPGISVNLTVFLIYVVFLFVTFSTFRSTLPRLRLDLLLDFI